MQGCEELLAKGGSKILPVLPQLIIPIKSKDIQKKILIKKNKRLNNYLKRGAFHQESGYHVRHIEKIAKASFIWRDDWRKFSSILSTNFTNT